MALDRFGRDIHYLRISLTDRCNLRCVYCMPEEMKFRPRAELMQDDELLQLVRLFTDLGFHKFRLTGGEPTVRANVVEIVRGMAQTPGVESLSMTTNGLLLKQLAGPLAEAGLQRVNISIDTLDPARFKRLTRWGEVQDVLDGIEASEAAGLLPIKLNAVVVKGYNEDDVVPLAALTQAHPWQMRFIEMMPFGDVAEFQQAQVVTAQQMRDKIEAGGRRTAGRRGTAVPAGKRPGRRGLHQLGDRAVLCLVHAGAADGRRQAAHVPAARVRSGPIDALAGRREPGRPARPHHPGGVPQAVGPRPGPQCGAHEPGDERDWGLGPCPR